MSAEETARMLLDIKAVSLKPKAPFRYASGILSPVYCDNRLLMGYHDKRARIRDLFIEKIKEQGLKFDVIAGTATAGIPHAAWIADKLGMPMIYIRGGAKDHGKQNQIEGPLENGQRVLVIEDLISTGGSSVAAVDAVRKAGGEVAACIAIFTYEMQKAKDKFAEAGCPCYTLSDLSTLINVAADYGYIKPEEKDILLAWNKAPADWGKKQGFE